MIKIWSEKILLISKINYLRLLIICVFGYLKKLFERNAAFFIRGKYSHLAACLHLIQPNLAGSSLDSSLKAQA